MEVLSRSKSFAGTVEYYRHASEVCHCEMTFSVFLPPQAEVKPVPVIYWLSGLTCTHENFITKAGAQYFAAKHGVALIMPDTSPRDLPIKEAHSGYGAGFYVNATQPPFDKYFNMFDYVVHELPALCESSFPILANQASIMGHSMGGHGALVMALRHPDRYRSVSAFAPICAPIEAPWGKEYFARYLGDDENKWRHYDASELIKTADKKIELFIDQGTEDPFLKNQLMPDQLKQECDTHQYPLNLRYQTGYDHSYFFISTFIDDHIAYHAKRLL